MRLALGTAQFGSSYGISNTTGQVDEREISNILNLAKDSYIDTIDTAMSYGNSESTLGSIGIKDFKLITKLPSLPKNVENVDKWVNEEVAGSLQRLKSVSLYALLLHNSNDLTGIHGNKLIKVLTNLRNRNLIQKLGVSIYDPTEIKKILKLLDIDIIQAPLNLIDRRLIRSGWLRKLKKESVEIHVRSVFLQGILLMPRELIPKRFEKWHYIWDIWHNNLADKKLDNKEECLQFVLSLKEIDRIIIGVQNSMQLRELIKASSKRVKIRDWSNLACYDQGLVNPSEWKML